MAADLPEIEDIKRLVLATDDVLVVRFRSRISLDQADRVRDVIRTELPLHNRVLVLDDGTTLDVLTAEQLTDLTSSEPASNPGSAASPDVGKLTAT